MPSYVFLLLFMSIMRIKDDWQTFFEVLSCRGLDPSLYTH